MFKKKVISLVMVLSIIFGCTSFVSTKAYASTISDKAQVSNVETSFSYELVKYYDADNNFLSEIPTHDNDAANYARYQELCSDKRVTGYTYTVTQKAYENGGTSGNYFLRVKYYVTYK